MVAPTTTLCLLGVTTTSGSLCEATKKVRTVELALGTTSSSLNQLLWKTKSESSCRYSVKSLRLSASTKPYQSRSTCSQNTSFITSKKNAPLRSATTSSHWFTGWMRSSVRKNAERLPVMVP